MKWPTSTPAAKSWESARPQTKEQKMLPLPEGWVKQEIHADFHAFHAVPDLKSAMEKLLMATCSETHTSDRGQDPVPTGFQVAAVHRIENHNLWKRYCKVHHLLDGKTCTALSRTAGGCAQTMMKSAMAPDFHKALNEDLNEVYLFHGTSADSATKIGNSGFDLVCASEESLYGPGVYLAEMSSKSDEYAVDSSDELRCILLCRVLLGETLTLTRGGPGVNAVVTEAVASGLYDSVLGDRQACTGTYREFVAYNADQVYPEYMILYRRVLQ
mmetsp:Transcript_34718/g.77922  ORF Transcript_34718/g.77922 Transcript_34718/m.77922 type:complete len:271 (+) Transcript_34718:375-1187(+)